jgi:hypothetical protein
VVKKSKGRKRKKRNRSRAAAKTVSKAKTVRQLRELKKKAATEILTKGSAGCCWFKDPSGRDVPVPFPSAEACKGAGGQWDPAPCPNV